MKSTKFALLILLIGMVAFVGCSDDDDDPGTPPVNLPELAFAGSDVCASCHGTTHDNWMHSGHPYKLTKLDGNTPTEFPDPSAYNSDATNPPVGTTWDDFSYTIGGFGWKMRWIQKDGYIYTPAAGQNQYNFEDQTWGDYHAGELKPYNCGACHTTGWEDSDDGIAENNQDGMEGFLGTFVYGGVHCENCHGMGTQHAYEPKSYALTVDRSSAFCGKCHTRGGDNGVTPGEDVIEAKGGFIKHHEQYDEWYHSAHNSTNGPGCNDCHNPHASVKFDATAPGDGVTATCASCHVDGTNADIAVTNHGYGATCLDCHMPDASKSAIKNNVHNGDVATHLWKINTSVNGKADMFNEDGTAVALDENSHGAISLEFACYGCHQDENGEGGPGSMKTMQQLSDKAANMHSPVPAKVANR